MGGSERESERGEFRERALCLVRELLCLLRECRRCGKFDSRGPPGMFISSPVKVSEPPEMVGCPGHLMSQLFWGRLLTEGNNNLQLAHQLGIVPAISGTGCLPGCRPRI